MIASPALLALREATASAHETLEVQARIEPRLSDPATRAATVAAFYRFMPDWSRSAIRLWRG